ncbi:MAG: SusD/RagB family nutrient-binding outer membrane lipoprotein [Terrimonas sp.]|nr:SusD/RagB family nutrient-binding outer membrane lipoprotein [Terrimonas sp.]OJY98042.1 MAG: hypothetical protein BGP13_10305 [Sphingobacteriales bacterium 40-81]
MKHISLKYLLVAGAVIFLVACTKDFKEINTNPRIVTEDIADPALLLTHVQKNSMFGMANNDTRLEAYSGYIGNNTIASAFTKGPWGSPFSTFYTSYLINLNESIRLSSRDEKLANLTSFGRIWRAWLYSRLTDLYGDIPYTEAAKSVTEVNIAPAYDTQEFVYTDMLKELKEAVAVLKQSDGTRLNIGNKDLIYNGDVEKWIRLGNSLRLRLAMRISYVAPSVASTHINELISELLIVQNSQNAILVAGAASEAADANRSPVYNGISGGAKEFRWASFTMAETLTKLNDPRASKFIDLTSLGDYFGIMLNLSPDEKMVDLGRPSSSLSALSDLFWRSDFRFTVINASEVAFLRAEAALRGITGEDAQALYRTGISLSMDNFGVNAADRDDYLAGSAGTLSGTEEQQYESLIVQKWLANYLQFEEGYTEFRRTGYPRIWTGSALGDTQGEIPRRVQYPQSEYNSNAKSISEAIKRLSNGDAFTSKLWWDVRPGLPVHHPKQGIFPPF